MTSNYGSFKPVTSILCIPGNWKDYEEFKKNLIITTGASYMVIGDILMDAKNGWHCTFEICERDDRMRLAFSAAGRVTRVSEEFLDEIDKHKYVIYLTAQTGNLEAAGYIAQAGCVILNAGGTGIKVESTGKAFEKEVWLEYADNFERYSLYDMFVLESLLDEEENVYSCGMHNIGLKDTIIAGEEFQDAVDLIRIFGFYQLVDKPVILHNQTFQTRPESPFYRITHEPDTHYQDHETFENPFGLWRLSKIN